MLIDTPLHAQLDAELRPWVLEVNCGPDFFEAGEIAEAHRRDMAQAMSLLVVDIAQTTLSKDAAAASSDVKHFFHVL